MTTPLNCAEAVVALGAYVVGALDPRERADVETHLAICPSCRDELTELAPLPGLMSRLTLDEAISGPPPVDDTILERLLSATGRERRSASRRRWLVAAAAVVVLAGGTSAGLTMWHSMHATHWQRVVASQGPVSMAVDMHPASSGTVLQLSLRGVHPGERCRLIAVADDGTQDVAGSWEASYSGTATIPGTTSIERSHLQRLIIRTYDGRTLVSAAVPAA